MVPHDTPACEGLWLATLMALPLLVLFQFAEPLLLLTKADLASPAELSAAYTPLGVPVQRKP